MVDRIYISSRYSQDQVARIMVKITLAGISSSGVCVWDSVGAFADTIHPGDRVVVHSLGVFDGSVELFGALRLFLEHGATVYSLREVALSEQLSRPLIESLYGIVVEGLLGRPAEVFSNVDPSTVERLARMERLMGQEGLSISEASRQSGCSRNVYYYYKRKDRDAVVDLQQSKAEGRTAIMRTNHSVWPQLSL